MKRSSAQSQQVILYLLALGLFSLCVLAVAAVRGKISAQISNDVSDAGRLRSYALRIFISEKDPSHSVERRELLSTMGHEIQRLLKIYPESSDDLIAAWRLFYSEAELHQLNMQKSQAMVDAADRFSSQISERADDEAKNGYLMLVYGALGLLLLLTRGFILVRELHRIETNLRNSERRFAILSEASLDGIAISENGIIEDTNAQFCALLGYEQADVIGHHLTDFASAGDIERSKEVIDNHQEITYEVHCVRKDKSTFPVEITARTLEFPGRVMRLTVARDITVRKQLEKEWEEANKNLAISNERWRTLATIDSLTGAYTRRALHLTMVREIRRASHSGMPFSVMILDIDGFKQYNDSFGHVSGDEVLRRVVNILRNTLRDVDVVSRYGGDEFVIVLVDTGALEANAVARRCFQAIAEVTDFKRNMTASFGVLTCFVEMDTLVNKEFCLGLVEDILVRVDKALYQSKLKDSEHITIADNLRVNNDFLPVRTSEPVKVIGVSGDGSVDELMDEVIA